jgi:hypothetical protein
MVIPLRNRAEHKDLYFRVAPLVQDLTSEALHPNTQNFFSLQALLLLCCWPLPYGSTKDDPSHAYITLATSIALRQGLHRPKHSVEFGNIISQNSDDLTLSRRTWVACFVLNQ